jgi:hypothetical protein
MFSYPPSSISLASDNHWAGREVPIIGAGAVDELPAEMPQEKIKVQHLCAVLSLSAPTMPLIVAEPIVQAGCASMYTLQHVMDSAPIL